MHKRFDISNYRTRLLFLGILMAGVIGSMILVFIQSRQEQAPTPVVTSKIEEVKPLAEPKLVSSDIVNGLSHPWDVVFLPDNSLLFNERSGLISRIKDGKKETVADINDVYAVGEGGLTGLALDSSFAENRYIYTCFNARTASGLDVRLVRWRLSQENKLEQRNDILTGIPGNASGRHSGCRIRVAKDGNLWVGTGDAAKASNPQDPKNLGGKILHITRDGMPAGNNLPAPFDPRIFSYGHRNVQGIVLFDQPTADDVYGYSVEHGSDRDDEVNLLKKGNFGWAPKVTYVENGIPMTDLERFPDAVPAAWSSGSPTIAPSGAAQLRGEKWGTYNGALAIAMLKGKQVKLLQFDKTYKLVQEKTILTDFGRIRSTALSPNGDLYITTDNGVDDKIIKITPTK